MQTPYQDQHKNTGALYSLRRSVPAIFIHENMPNRHQEDKISLPAKIHPKTPPGGVGQPPLAASGHHLRLGCFLVDPDVRWSVPGLGWSVWSGLWASFACVTLDTIVCDFVCVFVVFFPSSGYGCLQSKNHQNSWKWLVLSPITTFGVRKL